MDAEQTYTQALGQAIRTLGKDAGFSQESFADAVCLHRTYMGSVERGKQNLTVKNIVKVAEMLNLKPSELLAEAEKLLEA